MSRVRSGPRLGPVLVRSESGPSPVRVRSWSGLGPVRSDAGPIGPAAVRSGSDRTGGGPGSSPVRSGVWSDVSPVGPMPVRSGSDRTEARSGIGPGCGPVVRSGLGRRSDHAGLVHSDRRGFGCGPGSDHAGLVRQSRRGWGGRHRWRGRGSGGRSGRSGWWSGGGRCRLSGGLPPGWRYRAGDAGLSSGVRGRSAWIQRTPRVLLGSEFVTGQYRPAGRIGVHRTGLGRNRGGAAVVSGAAGALELGTAGPVPEGAGALPCGSGGGVSWMCSPMMASSSRLRSSSSVRARSTTMRAWRKCSAADSRMSTSPAGLWGTGEFPSPPEVGKGKGAGEGTGE